MGDTSAAMIDAHLERTAHALTAAEIGELVRRTDAYSAADMLSVRLGRRSRRRRRLACVGVRACGPAGVCMRVCACVPVR